MLETPIIALITDYGTVDSYVSEVKAVILRYRRDVQLVDITHEVEAFNEMEAAFVLRCASKTFPPGTIFLAVVDPGVGSGRQAIMVDTLSEKKFIGPDNGLMYPAAEAETIEKVYRIDYGMLGASTSGTFHGRDVFAVLVGLIISGRDLKGVLVPTSEYRRLRLPEPVWGEGEIRSSILHIDRFGNAVTNIGPKYLPPDISSFEIVFQDGRRLSDVPLKESYAGVDPGKPLLVFGGTGFLELSVNRGNASKFYNLKAGDRIVLKY